MTIIKGNYRFESIADKPSTTEVQRQYFFKTLYNNPAEAYTVFTDSFNKENVIGLAITNYIEKTRQEVEDPDYLYLEDERLLTGYSDFLSYFQDSKSYDHTTRLIKELKVDRVRNILSPLSVIGTVTGAVTDPSTLLLAGTGAKLLNVTAGGKTFMSPTRLGVAMTAEEMTKQLLDKKRDTNIGLAIMGTSFLLPGLINKLNGIGGLKTAKDLARYEKYTDSANSLEKTNVQKSLDELDAEGIDPRYLDPNETPTTSSAGAARTRDIQPQKSYNEEMLGEEISKTLLGLEDTPLTAVFRGLQKSVLSARQMVSDLLEIPLYQKKNFDLKGGATTISIENEINRGKAMIVASMRNIEDMYDKYLARMSKEMQKDIGGVSRVMRKMGVSKDGIMSFPEFRAAVSRALVSRSSNLDDEVVQAARIIRENFFNTIGRRADDSGLFLIMPFKQLDFWKGKLDLMRKQGLNTIKIEGQDFSTAFIKTKIEEIESKIKYISANTGLRKNYLPRFYKKDVIKKRKTEFTKIIYRALLKDNPNAKYKDAVDIVDSILTQQPFYRIQKWQKIIASEEGYISTPLGISDHVKARRLDLNDDELISKGFIEGDIFGLMRGYYRSIMPDIVLTEKFGDPGALGLNFAAGGFRPGLLQIYKEYQDRILRAKTKGDKAAIRREMVEALDDLEANIGLLRGTYGLSADPSSAMSSSIRVAKNITAMTYLSGILAAVPDVARVVMADGIKRNFGRLYEGFFKDMGWRMLKLSRSDAQLTGEATDMFLGTRAALFADTGDIFGLMNTLERKSGQITNFYFSYINAMNIWNTGVKNIASLVNGSKILDYVEAMAKGKAISEKARAQLKNLFIDEDMAKAIYEQYKQFGLGKGASESAGYSKLRVARADNWTDKKARDTYLSALQKDINITIVTPSKGDVPLWMNTEIGGVLAQFKKFGMAATQRVLMRGMQERDSNFMIGVVALVSMGAMVDAMRNRQFGRDYSKKKFGDKLVSAIERSAILGIFSDVNRMVETLSNNRLGLAPALGAGRPYQPTLKQKVGLFGPTASYIANLTDIMMDWGKGKHDYTTARAIRKTLPFQNIWYLDSIFDKFEKGIR